MHDALSNMLRVGWYFYPHATTGELTNLQVRYWIAEYDEHGMKFATTKL